MKLYLFISVLSLSLTVFSQDSLKINSIDSIINENEKKISRIILDQDFQANIITFDGETDTIVHIYTFTSRNLLISYSKAWINHNDTGQINTYYFDREKLLKTSFRVLHNKYNKVSYFAAGVVVYSSDSLGKSDKDTKLRIKDSKAILKRAKIKSKSY